MVVTEDNFESEVLKADGLIIVDFWAEWCGPCKMLSPTLEAFAQDKGLKLAKVDVDEQQKLAADFNIMSIPTVLFFKKGMVVSSIVGAVPRKVLEERFAGLA